MYSTHVKKCFEQKFLGVWGDLFLTKKGLRCEIGTVLYSIFKVANHMYPMSPMSPLLN